MQFKDVYKMSTLEAQELWFKRLNAVDNCISRIQDQKDIDAWSLNYWQNVRMALTRQLNNIRYENR